ncbi:MAG: glycerol-3-phosphate 1-O-acyltransferase PlsY [Oscillospiraceae bacterium]|nr:glycerol-3-phosphate 1-O-acyltransferase PlsY [Oscillospiraceae bacterium]
MTEEMNVVNFLFDNWLVVSIVAIIGYLLGSISFSVIFTKISNKKDIRNMGSKNAGFTNVLRSVGKMPAILTLLCDFLKGIMAILISTFFISITCGKIGDFALGHVSCIVGFFCILGHVYPCFFGFKGGKGVITSASVILMTNWCVLLAILFVFLLAFAFSRVVSFSSISAAIFYPVAALIFSVGLKDILLSIPVAILVILKHKSNIANIIGGREKKIFSW